MLGKIGRFLLLRPYIILLLLIISAFANSIDNSFLWDDHTMIVNNPNINLPARGMLSIFAAGFLNSAGATEFQQAYYRPVLSSYFILNYKIWGMNPVGFHISNILLYTVTVIFIYRSGLILFTENENSKLISLIGAAVFAVHPVNSAMAGRAASGEILLGFFIILSLYFFLAGRKYLSLFTFTLALLSKETAIMLPFGLVILSIDINGLKKGMSRIIPYIMIIGAYLILRSVFADTVFGNKIEKPVLTRILTMSVAALDYIKLFIIPYPLSIHYPARWYTSLLEPKVMIAIFGLISASFFIYKYRKDRIMLFLFLSPFIMLAPVIWRVSTFPVGLDAEYIAERFLYVPAMLFSLLISAYTVRFAGEKAKKHFIGGWVLIIALFTGITISSNEIWMDDFTLFSKIIEKSPDAIFAYNNLGDAYYNHGQINEAIIQFRTALQLKPEPMSHNNLGLSYYSQGKLSKALEEFNAALKPPDVPHQFDNVHHKQGNLKKTDLNITLWPYQPYFAEVHFNLGRVYLTQGNIEKAARKFKVATILRPDFAEAHYNLGNVYQKQGKLDEAIKEYQETLKIKPDYAEARKSLQILLQKQKNT